MVGVVVLSGVGVSRGGIAKKGIETRPVGPQTTILFFATPPRPTAPKVGVRIIII